LKAAFAINKALREEHSRSLLAAQRRARRRSARESSLAAEP
jgi:hypothetical protein